jgi:hypothetical protein
MTEYQFHSWPAGAQRANSTSVSLTVESRLHGAALALRHFMELGCDLAAPLAHLDVTGPDGVRHVLLIEEVRDWLHDAKQTAFVDREGLARLLH